jgi:hypothetical protein
MTNISYVIIACYADKGMKSYGSKSLIDFYKKKLLQYQIDCILESNHDKYEIIVISNFETQKIQKTFDGIKVVSLENTNPIYLGCQLSKYKQTIFIDYGCLFSKNLIDNIKKTSSIVCSQSIKNATLNLGCLVSNRFLEHVFFDLPDNKFCNIFSIGEDDKKLILQNTDFGYSNLLCFELINKLMEVGSIFDVKFAKQEDFIYFNHMRQKNAVNKFIKQTYN